jgi:hypothetical protein
MPIGMDDDEHAELRAESEENEPILFCLVIGIVYQDRLVIAEDRPRLIERDPVLAKVLACLGRIPLKHEAHSPSYIHCMYATSTGKRRPSV